MRGQFTLFTISMLVALCFALVSIVAPTTACAQYPDRSDELPGMSGFPTEIVLLGGALIAGLLIYKVAKSDGKSGDLPGAKKADDDKDEQDQASQEPDDEATVTEANTILIAKPEMKRHSLGFYLDVDQPSQTAKPEGGKPTLSDMTLKVGFTFGF